MMHSVTKEFTFTFASGGQRSTLTTPVTLPLKQSVKDYAGRLIHMHNIPCFVEDALINQLQEFVQKETDEYFDTNAENANKKVCNGEINVNELVDSWTKAFTQDVAEFASPEEVSNENVFSDVYHSLIHSPALETLLNLEHTYAMAVEKLTKKRDADLLHLQDRQHTEMNQAMQNLGTVYTDSQVNQLAQRHFESQQLIESKWASELSNLQETQKREYRDWVMSVHEDSGSSDKAPAYMQRVRTLSNTAADQDDSQPLPRLEDSFTIHLGAQLKTMHNLRLISAEVLDFCKYKVHKIGGTVIPQPQRLQTAMSLYSNSLCGLVLLVDNRLNSYFGIKRDFAKVCEQSTDFHFSNLEQQFSHIEQDITRANEWRAKRSLLDDGDKISVKSSSSNSSSEKEDKSTRMQTGDFYITRHSNLSEVHAVFHLVTDNSVLSTDVSSRHPVILGYRNILKACVTYDINTITLPLFLAHEMTEEMTISWCMKRAELVFKCVKGFMMELAMWGGRESRTIQFLVPRSLSDDMFASLSNMLPSIFRMSNPLVVKSS